MLLEPHWTNSLKLPNSSTRAKFTLFLACTNISEYHSFIHNKRVESIRVACEAPPDNTTVLNGAGRSTKTTFNFVRLAIATVPTSSYNADHHVFEHEMDVTSHCH